MGINRINIEEFSAEAITVGTAAIDVDGTGLILELAIQHKYSVAGFEVENLHATIAFDAFAIHIQAVQGGDWEVYLATGTTWGTESTVMSIFDLSMTAPNSLSVNFPDRSMALGASAQMRAFISISRGSRLAVRTTLSLRKLHRESS